MATSGAAGVFRETEEFEALDRSPWRGTASIGFARLGPKPVDEAG